MLDLNKNFVDEVYDENGHVVDYTLKCPENFNFAYDVVDAIAAAEPDKRALLWCNPAGEFLEIANYNLAGQQYAIAAASLLTRLQAKSFPAKSLPQTRSIMILP